MTSSPATASRRPPSGWACVTGTPGSLGPTVTCSRSRRLSDARSCSPACSPNSPRRERPRTSSRARGAQRPDLVVHEVAELASPPLDHGVRDSPYHRGVQRRAARGGPGTGGRRGAAAVVPSRARGVLAGSRAARPRVPPSVRVVARPASRASRRWSTSRRRRSRPWSCPATSTTSAGTDRWSTSRSGPRWERSRRGSRCSPGLASLDVDVLATVGSAVDPASIPRPPAGAGRSTSSATCRTPRSSGARRWSCPTPGPARRSPPGPSAVPQLMIPLGADQFENASAFTDGRRRPTGPWRPPTVGGADRPGGGAAVRRRGAPGPAASPTSSGAMPNVGETLRRLLR